MCGGVKGLNVCCSVSVSVFGMVQMVHNKESQLHGLVCQI